MTEIIKIYQEMEATIRIFKKLFGGRFLSTLTAKERPAVSDLQPLLYETIIKEKSGKDTLNVISDNPLVVECLRRLAVPELQRLCESVKLGMQADQTGNPREQARLYKRAAELNPYNYVALMSYGCILANQGNLRQGITWIEKAVKANPDFTRARQNLKGMKADLRRQ